MNNLKLDVADQIAVLTINRPGALNALNSETLDELNAALTEIEARDDVKVVYPSALLWQQLCLPGRFCMLLPRQCCRR